MSLIDVLATILVFSLIGVLGLVLVRFIRVPYTLMLVILGFAASWLTGPLNWDTGIRASNFQELMMFVLLPVLIFEAALSLDEKLLRKFMPNVLTLATLGLLISTGITAVFLYYGINHPGFPLLAALIAGVVVSATDPVAVVGQLKQLKAPKDLNVLIEGESLFNDATAIVLFGILLSIATGAAQPSVGEALFKFALVFFGGILVGAALGVVAGWLCKVIEIEVPHLCLLTLLLAYGSFYIGEHLLHVSGIVAVMFSALAFKRAAADSIKRIEHELHEIWQSLGYIANVFVFVLLGLVVTVNMFSAMWLAMLLAVIGALIARIIAVYASVWLNQYTFGQAINPKYPPIMIWGGLRGAVTIALVLSLPTELPYWWTIQSIGFGVVLFTLLIQATSNPFLVKKMKL
jgi:CPA1 family monovalent cation:H+ antiporter